MTHNDLKIEALRKQLAQAYAASRALNTAQGFSLSEQGRKAAQARAVIIQNEINKLEAENKAEIPKITTQQDAIRINLPIPTNHTSTPTLIENKNNGLIIAAAIIAGVLLL